MLRHDILACDSFLLLLRGSHKLKAKKDMYNKSCIFMHNAYYTTQNNILKSHISSHASKIFVAFL